MERTKGLVKRAEKFADSKDRANLASKYTAWKEGFIEGYLAAVSDGLASGEGKRPDESSGLHLADVTQQSELLINFLSEIADKNNLFVRSVDLRNRASELLKLIIRG